MKIVFGIYFVVLIIVLTSWLALWPAICISAFCCFNLFLGHVLSKNPQAGYEGFQGHYPHYEDEEDLP